MFKKLNLCFIFSFAITVINNPPAKAHGVHDPDQANEIEIVFVLDTTGSMSDLIHAAKEKIWSIATTFSQADPAPKIKMGLIGYRDIGDQYITKVFDLTNNIDDIYTELMKFEAAGGGDTPESVNRALYEAVEKISWSQSNNIYKTIFLVGDAPPHMDYQDDVKYSTSSKKAVTKGVIINTIQCGSMRETTPIWKEIAKLGFGDFFQVAQSGNAVLYDTPYDQRISELSLELDKTKIYYGSQSDLDKGRLKMQQAEKIGVSASYSAKAKRAIYNSSASGYYNFTGSKDLVTDFEENNVNLSEIKKDHLPKIMSPMSLTEQENFLKEKSKRRTEIQKEIQDLSQKRQDYLSELVKKEKNQGKDTLDYKLFNSLKNQAQRNNIYLEEYQW